MIAGKDPLEDSGGHSGYVRVWARAATLLGYRPELFSVSFEKDVVDLPFGRLHRVPSPFRWFARPYHTGIRSYASGWHAGMLARAILARAWELDPSRPLILHGFHVWTIGAVRAAKVLRAQGHRVCVLMSAYTTAAHELNERWRGTLALPGIRPKLLMLWEMLNLHLFMIPCERQACRESDRILVNYESVRRLVMAAWAPHCPIKRVPYTTESVFIEDRKPTPLPEGVPMVLAVSRHDSRKGLDTLLRALARLKNDGVKFRACLVGSGSLLPVHRRLAGELGLDGVAEIIGYVEDVEPYWRAASVFVLPSHEEGSGSLSLLEALQHGRAVVASGIDGIPEDVEDGRSALLVPPKNPEALAAALRRVLENENLRCELGHGARKRFDEKFAPNRLVSEIRDLYNP